MVLSSPEDTLPFKTEKVAINAAPAVTIKTGNFIAEDFVGSSSANG